ncbi:hypothetical protein BDV11DRAFT_209917 [Aspergillus similis]
MKDSNCHEPNSECEFADGGRPGASSDTTVILIYAEVSARNHLLDVDTFYDSDITVKYDAYKWLMIWAIYQDDGDFNALSGVFGQDVGDALANVLRAYSSQNFFVIARSTDRSSGERNPDQACLSGFMSVETAHNTLQAPGHGHHGLCSEECSRHISCLKSAMSMNCK